MGISMDGDCYRWGWRFLGSRQAPGCAPFTRESITVDRTAGRADESEGDGRGREGFLEESSYSCMYWAVGRVCAGGPGDRRPAQVKAQRREPACRAGSDISPLAAEALGGRLGWDPQVSPPPSQSQLKAPGFYLPWSAVSGVFAGQSLSRAMRAAPLGSPPSPRARWRIPPLGVVHSVPREGTIIIPISQRRKLRLREISVSSRVVQLV